MVAAAVKTYEAKQLSAIGDYTFELSDLIVWASIEFNLLIICGSVPMLRALFKPSLVPKHPYFHHRHHHHQSSNPAEEQELSQYKSTDDDDVDTKHMGKGSVESVTGSQENIVPQSSTVQATSFSSASKTTAKMPAGISRTVEFEVKYEKSDAPAMHAALVGLKQGEDSNPHLTRR